jgi:hypothetical protein
MLKLIGSIAVVMSLVGCASTSTSNYQQLEPDYYPWKKLGNTTNGDPLFIKLTSIEQVKPGIFRFWWKGSMYDPIKTAEFQSVIDCNTYEHALVRASEWDANGKSTYSTKLNSPFKPINKDSGGHAMAKHVCNK